jgi:hypothetical protein
MTQVAGKWRRVVDSTGLFSSTNGETLVEELAGYIESPAAYVAGQTNDSAGSFEDALSATWTPRASGTNNWEISFDASVTAPATFSAISRLEIDGTPYAEHYNENGGNWIGASGGVIVSLNKSAHTIKVQVKTSSAPQTASMKEIIVRARLVNI